MVPKRMLLGFGVLVTIALSVRCEQMDLGMMEEAVGGCHLISGLTRSQRRVCSRSPTSAAAALQGLQTAVRECQHQMRWHRWNCSTLESRKLNPHSTTMLQRGYKESAFAYAITSAGVAHAVARACAQGLLLACSCDPGVHKFPKDRLPDQVTLEGHPQGLVDKKAAYSWKWGGCSHNMEYGMAFSKLFLDSREKAGDLHSNVNLHNNEAGRLAVSNNMEVKCKCHGTSGSCQLRTCWKATPDFRVVGKQLKNKYRNAIMVGQSNINNAPPHMTKRRDRPSRKPGKKRPWRSGRKHKWRQWTQPVDSLLYYERSPNYCERDPELDILGTAGRRCSRPKDARGSCDALCCGRGYNRLRTRTVQRCRCRFHWCCRVDCDTCVEEDFVAVCK